MYKVLKFLLDKFFAVVIILLFAPCFPILAILIKLTPGPIFYAQTRIGKGGHPFNIYKFRTTTYEFDIHQDQDYVQNLIEGEYNNIKEKRVFALENDPRLTVIGRYLRKMNLEEIPQIFNVLKGDMSLVGPRPALPYEVDHYDKWQKRRLEVKPGFTGLSQVRCAYDLNYNHGIKYDLLYIKKRSILLDLKILLQTIPLFISRSGY